jgi:hypothetical protein
MKKINLLSVLFLSFLWSCDKQEMSITTTEPSNIDSTQIILESGVDNSLTDSSKILQAKTTGMESFNIVYALNFNSRPAGNYATDAWKADWNNPAWANHDIGYGNIINNPTTGNKYMQEKFPKGTFLLTKVGTQWLSKLKTAGNEYYFSYKVKFSKGFLGSKYDGKLPGLGGGTCASAGNLPSGTDGWSSRYMFHATAINFYLYYPDLYKQYGDATPIAGKKYYGCGPILNPGFTLQPEVWYTVTQRIVLNNPGKLDGIAEGYINGKLCAQQKGIRFRDVSTLKIDYIFFANFFGGSGIAPLADEYISFDDFYVYTYASTVNVARGNTASAAGTVIPIPQ